MSTSNPFVSTNYKTIVVRPGETQVIKKNLKILKVINDGNVTVSGTCTDLEGDSEPLVEYALIIETVNELINKKTSNSDFITGIGLGNDFYRFASPVSLNSFETTYPSADSGQEKLFKAMVNALPGGSVFLRDVSYTQENWNGPAGDSTRDNFYRSAIIFKSFPSLVEDLGMYVLYENTPSYGANLTKYNMRIYPSRTQPS